MKPLLYTVIKMADELANQKDVELFGSDTPKRGELYIMLATEGDRKWFEVIPHCAECSDLSAVSQESMSQYQFTIVAFPPS